MAVDDEDEPCEHHEDCPHAVRAIDREADGSILLTTSRGIIRLSRAEAERVAYSDRGSHIVLAEDE